MTTLAKKIGVSAVSLAVLCSTLPGLAFGQSAPPNPPPDELFQLNGLTVTAIEISPQLGGPGVPPLGRVLATVTATAADNCLYYRTESSSPVACTNVFIRQYTIGVTGATQLLDRNRKQVSISDFAVGDKFNVYGTMNPLTGAMTASVMRNLSKPVATTKVQLERLTVEFSKYDESTRTLSLQASQGPGPCYDFSSAGAKRPLPCPLAAQVSSAAAADHAMPTFPTRLYEITVPPTAKVLDAKRNPMSPKDVAVGDIINVYGSTTDANRSVITAEILRDLSFSAGTQPGGLSMKSTTRSMTIKVGEAALIEYGVSGGRAPYTWSSIPSDPTTAIAVRQGLPPGMVLKGVHDGLATCMAIGCPVLDNASATVSGSPTTVGKYYTNIRVTDAQGRSASLPLTITVAEGTRPIDPVDPPEATNVTVSVETDRNVYRMDETMEVHVTAKNSTRTPQRLAFSTGCQAYYDLVPGYSGAPQACTDALTSVFLGAGEKKTWKFSHDLATQFTSRVAFPAKVEVRGTVIGYGSSSKTVVLRDAKEYQFDPLPPTVEPLPKTTSEESGKSVDYTTNKQQ